MVRADLLMCAEDHIRPPVPVDRERRCRRCGCRLSMYHPEGARECWPCLARSKKS